MLNRHGLVAGATGTGKTKTLQLMAEQLSANGVPVFAADIKGDLSGISAPGEREREDHRPRRGGRPDWTATGYPVEFYSLGGQGTGIPFRATMTAFGPLLLAKVLGLNETQESSLGLVFHYADQAGLPLLDLEDLRAVVQFLTSDEGKADLKDARRTLGRTAGVILRELIAFADQGADAFFGEPEFESAELLQVAADGAGVVSLLELPQPPGPAGALLDLPDVAARRPLPRPARGRRPRQAEAGLLLRRGPPALQRRLQGVPRPDRADRAADPVQGRRRLLRDPEPERRARRGARPARLPGPAPAARLHPQRRQGAEGDREDLPATRPTRPRRGAHQPRHRRGDRDGDERARRPDAGRLDPAARPRVADGAGRRRRHAGRGHRQPADAKYADRRSTASRPARSSPPRVEEGAARHAEEEAAEARAKEAAKAERSRSTSSGRRTAKDDGGIVKDVVQSGAFKDFMRTAAREIARGMFGTGRRR